MAHALTAATPATPATAAVAAAPSVPDGSDFRTAESLYGAFQAILNLASIGAGFVTGATIGDGTQTVTLNNVFATSAGKNITSGQDLVSTRDVNSGRDLNCTRNLSVTDIAAVGSLEALGDATVGGHLTGGKVVRTAPALDSNHTYDMTAADDITPNDPAYVAQTANRTWKIANGVLVGQYVRVVKDTSGFTVAVENAAGASVANLSITSGQFRWVGLIWNGTTWVVEDFGLQV